VLPGGSIYMSSITLLPAIQEAGPARTWQFAFQGSVAFDEKKDFFQILMDFKEVTIADQFFITFESVLSGIMIIDGKVFSANRYINYTPNNEEKTILFDINLPCPKKNVFYDMNFIIADGACSPLAPGCWGIGRKPSSSSECNRCCSFLVYLINLVLDLFEDRYVTLPTWMTSHAHSRDEM